MIMKRGKGGDGAGKRKGGGWRGERMEKIGEGRGGGRIEKEGKGKEGIG